MTQIAFARNQSSAGTLGTSGRRAPVRITDASTRNGVRNARADRDLLGVRQPIVRPESEEPITEPSLQSSVVSVVLAGESIEKVVRRIPTLYVIALFTVIVSCAVLTIWNTLQVNKLTQIRVRNEQRIAESEQRLVKLRAEEMQLAAPSRIRQLAEQKLGMTEAQREDLVLIH